MIRISLDESGNFEREKESLVVGGILFDDADEEGETERELERIKRYLKRITDSLNVEYPKFLHERESMTSTEKKKVYKVKEQVEKTIASFIQNGTYNNEPVLESRRKGSYRLFCYIT